MNFAVHVDHWVKIKDNEKRDIYMDFIREQRNLWRDGDISCN